MIKLDNVKLSAKLIGGFLVVAILLAVVAAVGYINMKTINDDMTTMYDDRLVPITQMSNIEAAVHLIRGDLYGLLLFPDERAEMELEITENRAEVEKNIEQYRATFLVQAEIDHLAEFDAAWVVYQKEIADVIAKVETGLDKEAIAAMRQGGTLYNARIALDASVTDIIAVNEEVADAMHKEGDATFAGATLTTAVVGVLAVILAVVVGVVLSRSITTPLSQGVAMMQAMARGDTGARLKMEKRGDEVGILARAMDLLADSTDATAKTAEQIATDDLQVQVKMRSEQDVLGKAFAQMVEMLRRSTADISQSVELLGSSASEILAATTQVAAGAAESATAISETTSTVEEVRQAAQLSSQKAQIVSDSAQRVAQVSQSGQQAVQETSAGMDRIREQMETIAQTVVRLSEQSQSIGGIIASVTDLADQSNLLAVNAAIEAAKAGEQGKGFAVVAQEIKSLAEQSKQATAQVRDILSDVQKATSAAVMATEQGSKAVEAGVKQSVQAGEAIRVLAETSGEAAQAATQIVVSSQQQVVGMDQIGAAMENINQAGSQNATSMRQMEIAAQNLHELGQKLKELVEQFKT